MCDSNSIKLGGRPLLNTVFICTAGYKWFMPYDLGDINTSVTFEMAMIVTKLVQITWPAGNVRILNHLGWRTDFKILHKIGQLGDWSRFICTLNKLLYMYEHMIVHLCTYIHIYMYVRMCILRWSLANIFQLLKQVHPWVDSFEFISDFK